MKYITLLPTLLLIGCVNISPSVPNDYSGETAVIDDTIKRTTRITANIFYLERINGKNIVNALMETRSMSSGKGMQTVAVATSRKIPTTTQSLHLVGQTYYAAPIAQMLSDQENIILEGQIDFSPEPNKKYIINGHLDKEYSAIWIEDMTGAIVSEIIESPQNSKSLSDIKRENSKPQTKDRNELFLGLFEGESSDSVIAKLGQPDIVEKTQSNAFLQRRSSAIYEYDNLGSIQFIYLHGEKLHIRKVFPTLGKTLSVELAKIHMKADGAKLGEIAKQYYLHPDLGQPILDIIAGEIWQSRDTVEPYRANAIAWLCKVIGNSGDARYRNLLEEVKNKSTISKIRRHASNHTNSLEDKDVAQFVFSDTAAGVK